MICFVFVLLLARLSLGQFPASLFPKQTCLERFPELFNGSELTAIIATSCADDYEFIFYYYEFVFKCHNNQPYIVLTSSKTNNTANYASLVANNGDVLITTYCALRIDTDTLLANVGDNAFTITNRASVSLDLGVVGQPVIDVTNMPFGTAMVADGKSTAFSSVDLKGTGFSLMSRFFTDGDGAVGVTAKQGRRAWLTQVRQQQQQQGAAPQAAIAYRAIGDFVNPYDCRPSWVAALTSDLTGSTWYKSECWPSYMPTTKEQMNNQLDFVQSCSALFESMRYDSFRHECSFGHWENRIEELQCRMFDFDPNEAIGETSATVKNCNASVSWSTPRPTTTTTAPERTAWPATFWQIPNGLGFIVVTATSGACLVLLLCCVLCLMIVCMKKRSSPPRVVQSYANAVVVTPAASSTSTATTITTHDDSGVPEVFTASSV